MSNPIIRGFWSTERRFPALRTAAWRLFYDAVAWGFPDPDLAFMNWGYVGPDIDESTTGLGEFAERNRTMIQLYAHTIGNVDLHNREVVEIGSGRGGGAAWVALEKCPAKITGVDLAPRAVRLATKLHHGINNLRFLHGSALDIPLPDASTHAVINVESCHHYADIDRFLFEVMRILKPGGYLLLSDYRNAAEMPALEAAINRSGLQVVRHHDITENVLVALHQDNEWKDEIVRTRVSRVLRPVMREFLANMGSDIQQAFADRTMRYASWIACKP